MLSPPIIALDNVSVGYEAGKPVLNRVTLRIDTDDRIALLGANGNGKSTLVKLIAGKLAAFSGQITRADKLSIGYFAQHQVDELDSEGSTYDHIRRLMGDAPEAKIRARAGAVGFSGKAADTLVSSLSGGEKARLLLGLATSASPSRTFSTLERMNVRHYFSAVITAADVSHGKPDPAVYRLACDRLNVDYGTVLAFEDAVSGIQAAREAGLKCAGVARSPRAEKLLLAGAEFVIENFAGLSLGILKSKLVPAYRLSNPESAAP